ncbi:hypothetical protein [Vitreoscilla stercoraria]|uniref:Uncharacterized protein n=1 Tax=Vitreoscilla stercoraria TaxID=61 RepID=A0ABY4ECY8_VITST|nr:hypothetical protein [Vitreoscilla stercoraria]UOO93607.1 hypothetical protein LVJ81_06170 [Vitreoscilla stercoraria]
MQATTLTKPKLTIRARMWDLFRANKQNPLTRVDIARELELEHNSLVDGKYLRFCVNAGILTKTTKKVGQLDKRLDKNAEAWVICKDVGIEAPRFHKDGTLMTQSGVNEAIWRSIRILKSFNRSELASHVAHLTNEATVQAYLYSLRRAGYVAWIDEKTNSYRLVKNTGPKPPQVLRVKEIYDPNIDEIVMREVPDCE